MISGVVIAKNEADLLPVCLSGLKFCSRLLVIDNGSTDSTAQVAKSMGAKVLSAPNIRDFSQLRNLALNHVSTPWTFFVDADETVPPGLVTEIMQAISRPGISGYYIPRRDVFLNRTLRYGDTGTIRLLRLGKTISGKWSGQVHETWNIRGNTGCLSTALEHRQRPGLVQFLRKLNYYSDLRARELCASGIRGSVLSILLYPAGKFTYLWLVKLGFLDGTVGLIHAMCMAFYSFLTRGKLYLISHPIRVEGH